MTEHTSFLCVGGPRAGQRMDAKLGTGFCVPVYDQLLPIAATYGHHSETVTVRHFYYRREVFHTPQGDVSFWTPQDQSPLETMKLLLETYESTLSIGMRNP